jgi:hypothetical protein
MHLPNTLENLGKALHVRMYHCSFQTKCLLFQARAYMTSGWHHVWLSTNLTKCVPDASNMCPCLHMKRLDAEGWIKARWKCNAKVNVECVMWNERINDLATNHSPTPLPEQEQMRALDAEEIKSSSKINLKDVLWWMSIKDACRLGVLITARFSKERCISLTTRGKSFCSPCKHDWNKCGPFQPEKHTLSKWVCWKYEI